MKTVVMSEKNYQGFHILVVFDVAHNDYQLYVNNAPIKWFDGEVLTEAHVIDEVKLHLMTP